MTMFSELSALFAAYDSGTKVATTGLTINGSDLSDLFAPVSQGAATVPTTGIAANGTDIALLFAGAGTLQKLLTEFVGAFVDYQYGGDDQYAAVVLNFAADGTFTGAGRSGRWLTAGISSALYEISIALTSGSALDYNDAITYQPLSTPRACALSATIASVGTVSKTSNLTITIREIATPANKVEVAVTLTATAQSYGGGSPP